MADKPRVTGLDAFRLTLPALTRLGDRRVRLSIQLVGRDLKSLMTLNLRPDDRDARLRETLARQLSRLRRRFPDVRFTPRARGKPSWTLDATVPARVVRDLAARREVKDVRLDRIDGRRKSARRQDA